MNDLIDEIFAVEANIDYLKVVIPTLKGEKLLSAQQDLDHYYAERERLESQREANRASSEERGKPTSTKGY